VEKAGDRALDADASAAPRRRRPPRARRPRSAAAAARKRRSTRRTSKEAARRRRRSRSIRGQAASRTRPKPPPPPPQDDPPPERRSGSGPRDAIRQSGIRDAQQKPGNGKTPSGVKDAVRQSGIRDAQKPKDPARASGVKPPSRRRPVGSNGEVRLEKPVEVAPGASRAGPSPALLALAVAPAHPRRQLLGWRAWTDSQAQIRELAAKATRSRRSASGWRRRASIARRRNAPIAKALADAAAAAATADAGTPPELDAGGTAGERGKKPDAVTSAARRRTTDKRGDRDRDEPARLGGARLERRRRSRRRPP
jgi:hypothetical protein